MIGTEKIMCEKFIDLSYYTTSYIGKKRLKITIEFLVATGFDGKFIIVDATPKNNSEYFSQYNFVTYEHHPNCTPIEGIALAANLVASKYAAYIGDDDLPILSGVKKALQFLDSNQDYDAVSGQAGYCNFDKLQNFDALTFFGRLKFAIEILFSYRYDQTTNLGDQDAIVRLRSIREKYVVNQFFITRTNCLTRIYNESFFNIQNVHASEYSFCFAFAAICRTKQIKNTYLFRGIGSHRPNANPNLYRHRINDIDKIIRQVVQFVKHMKLPQSCADEIVSNVKQALNNFTNQKNAENIKIANISYFSYLIKRLHFSITGLSKERIYLAIWGSRR